jgi:DNA repair protein RecO (recombination protein O)
MHSYSIEGIVLKRSDFGETDRLITLFTKTHGKITVMAKGVRRLSSKRIGSLELFTTLQASIHPGRGSLDTLGEVTLVSPYPRWKKHLGRINLAYQLAEAVDKLTPDRESHPEVYAFLHHSLLNIGNLGSDWQVEFRSWLVQLVEELGYWPKDRIFTGDIYAFLESLAARPLNSPKLLQGLRS